MTDRELLELAARAAGYRLTWGGTHTIGGEILDCTDLPYVIQDSLGETLFYWNPLEDDGDALRLAVKLNMGISIPVRKTPRADVITFRDPLVNVIESGNDPYAATCRAIVRAAAEIGKLKGEQG